MRKQYGAQHCHNMPVRVPAMPASEKIAGGSSLLEPFGNQADSPNHFSMYLHAFVSIHLAHSIIHSCPFPPPSLAPSPITNGWWSSLRCNKTARSRGCTALLMTLLGEVCFIIHPSLGTLTSCLTLLPIAGGGNSLLRLCCYRSSLVVCSTVRTCLRSRGPSYRVFGDIACSRGATAGEIEGERGSV